MSFLIVIVSLLTAHTLVLGGGEPGSSVAHSARYAGKKPGSGRHVRPCSNSHFSLSATSKSYCSLFHTTRRTLKSITPPGSNALLNWKSPSPCFNPPPSTKCAYPCWCCLLYTSPSP